MSRKKKQDRKQLREQRRAAMARKRMETGWKPPSPPSVVHDEVTAGMPPPLPGIGDSSPLSPAMDRLMMIMAASTDMADEPEFEDLFVDPLLCANTFATVGLEMGHDPDSLLALPDQERQDVQADMLIETIRRLLTDDLRREILDGLETLQLRLKQAGDQGGTARAAALQSFLSQDLSAEMWAMIGLVQVIFDRSITVGFELAEASLEILETKDASEEPAGLIRRLARSTLGKRAEALLEKVPGLGGYLTKQADKTWEEGLEAVYEGDLSLGLFSEEELAAGVDIMGTALTGKGSQGETTKRTRTRKPSQKEIGDMISSLERYLAELCSSERLGQLRARLDAILNERAYDKKWLPFLFMVREYMAAPDAVENEKPFLITAFLGEIRAAGEAAMKAGEAATVGRP